MIRGKQVRQICHALEALSGPGGVTIRELEEKHDGPVAVTLRFSRSQARYAAERVWAPGQALCENPDGTADLHFSTRGVRDVKKWVLGWGADVEVLEPEWLRAAMKEIFEEMAKKYG